MRPLGAAGWLGLALLALGQLLTLVHLRPLSDSWYGLCWTGVILVGDAWLRRRGAPSLVRDRPLELAAMALTSAALWWGLELANHSMQAWDYSASPDIPLWRQRLRSTWFFATLIPGVWITGAVTVELLRDASWVRRPSRSIPRWARGSLALLGLGLLALAPWQPRLALGLILLGLVLVCDPINAARGRPSLLAALETGDLRAPLGFAIGAMASGIVGEAWNYPASPKWTYDVPYIDFAHVFELPALGLLGYGLLSWAVFCVYHFVRPRGLASAATRPEDALALTGL